MMCDDGEAQTEKFLKKMKYRLYIATNMIVEIIQKFDMSHLNVTLSLTSLLCLDK